MTDNLIEESDGFRLGVRPTDDDVDRANWLIDKLSARILADADRIAELEAENARLREALSPSCDTKVAYMSEVECDCPTENWRHFVPWTSIKDIMAMIRARAALAEREKEDE